MFHVKRKAWERKLRDMTPNQARVFVWMFVILIFGLFAVVGLAS